MSQVPLGRMGPGRRGIRIPAKPGNQPWKRSQTAAGGGDDRGPRERPADLPAPVAPSGPGCGRGVNAMTVARIIHGLETLTATGPDAATAARLGFLEWAFCARDGGTPQAARDALDSHAARNAQSDAARVFVGYLRQATFAPLAKGRRRTRLLH